MIVTLCGSVRLGRDIWDEAAENLTLEGHLVFTVNVWDKYDYLHSHEGQTAKELLDLVHKEKISLSDKVVVLHENGYIGPSTRSEVQWAEINNKTIEFVEVRKEESA